METRQKVGNRFLTKSIAAICAKTAIAGTLLGIMCSTPQKAEYTTTEQPASSMESKIEQMTKENREIFSYLKDNLDIRDFYVSNQEGRRVATREILIKSMAGDEAKKYAKNLAETAHRKSKGKKYETLESKITLAKGIIDNARKQLQRIENGGKGNYTLTYEYSYERENMLREADSHIIDLEKNELIRNMIKNAKFEGADSVQTFDEFYKEKDGKARAGDCDDFSMALTTTYHALKEYSESKKDKDGFYKALAEGLDSYRIFSIGVIGHALNMSATLRDMPYFQIIEPQNMKTKYDLNFKDGWAFIKELDSTESVNKIVYIFNKDFSAYAKTIATP